MRVLGFLLRQIKRVKGVFLLAVLIYLGATALARISPLLLQEVIDRGLTALSQGNLDKEMEIYSKLAAYLALNVIGALLSYISARMLLHCANRLAELLRNQAYDVMQGLPISYFDDKPAGKIATRIVNDTETIRTQFYDNLVQIFATLIKQVFTYAVVFYMSPSLGFLLLTFLPIFYGVQYIYKKATDKPMKEFYEARSTINTQVNETMNGASLIQLYGQEEQVVEDFEAAAKTMMEAENRIIWVQSLATWNMTELLKYLLITLILTVVGYRFLAGQLGMTAGLLFIYINYVIDSFDSMGQLVHKIPHVLRSLETGSRLLVLLDQPLEADNDVELLVKEGQVVFDRVDFAYEEGKPVLKNISLKAEQGETVALVGHTGSGKSSIMNLLYRFYDPQGGQVRIDGQNIRDYSRESLRSQMGIVLQDPYLFTGTIASNVSMDAEHTDRERVLEALEKVGATDLLSRLEKGIDEPVVEKGSAFSSGERQLISFARTLYANPKILILDEATSHIDTETEEIIQHAMEVVKEGRTTFIIAHRLSTIQNADQILVLSEGQIIERGRHEELLALNSTYAHMHRIQQKVGVEESE